MERLTSPRSMPIFCKGSRHSAGRRFFSESLIASAVRSPLRNTTLPVRGWKVPSSSMRSKRSPRAPPSNWYEPSASGSTRSDTSCRIAIASPPSTSSTEPRLIVTTGRGSLVCGHGSARSPCKFHDPSCRRVIRRTGRATSTSRVFTLPDRIELKSERIWIQGILRASNFRPSTVCVTVVWSNFTSPTSGCSKTRSALTSDPGRYRGASRWITPASVALSVT